MSTIIHSRDYDPMGDKSKKENRSDSKNCNGVYKSGVCQQCDHYEGRGQCSKYEQFRP